MLIRGGPTDVKLVEEETFGTFQDFPNVVNAQVTRSSGMDDVMLGMITNGPRVTEDMELADMDMLSEVQDTVLPIEAIAELVYQDGSIVLKNPVDADAMLAHIDTYVSLINEKVMFSPHYKGPPAEDFQALEKLAGILRPVAEQYRRYGTGGSAMSRLRAILGAEATTVGAEEAEPSLMLSGSLGSASLVANSDNWSTSPYDFG